VALASRTAFRPHPLKIVRPAGAAGVESSQGEPAGDRGIPSFRGIVDDYGVQVWRTLHYCGVHSADIQDLCQEVFLVIHRRIAEFEGRSSLRTWIYQICIRVAAGHRRKARFRYEQVVAETPDCAVAPTQADALDDARMLDRLFVILNGLEQCKREVFVLYEMEEQSMSEIAEALNCPLRTAYSRLEAARQEVTRAWQREEIRWRKP
jgi:RNA polymerase sigma-70 factor (ECF subfamily)